jgi:hypothetical protein
MLIPAITGDAGYAALLHEGPGFDLDLVEATVLDGRTVKLIYEPHLHTGMIDDRSNSGPRMRWRRSTPSTRSSRGHGHWVFAGGLAHPRA